MADTAVATSSPSKALNIGLWVVQVLVAFAFANAGFLKTMSPVDELVVKVPWSADVPLALVRFIGSCEMLGALGVLLPSLTRIKPKLTPLAAAGLVTVMTLAAIFHLTRGEYVGIAINSVLGGLAAFVAWGRYKKAPIAPRAS